MSTIKKHPVPVILAVCAVIAVLSLLWYTRPRSWENLSYTGEPTRFSAGLHTTVINGQHTGFETCTLDWDEGLEDPCRQILALLEEAAYRVRPWDTLTYGLGRGYTEAGVSGSISVFQSWDQGQQAESFTLYSSGTVIKDQTIYTAKLDGANLYQAIAAVIQEYGT